MKYRPEYHLDLLRTMVQSAEPGQQQQSFLHLRWLRTMVADLRRTPKDEPQQAAERMSLLQRSAVGCAVERVLCKQLSGDRLTCFFAFLRSSIPRLNVLDLRDCSGVSEGELRSLASAHRHSLQRLYLPCYCNVAQSTLDHFTQLEELDASECFNLENVDFCSATLRVLHAKGCTNLTLNGLRSATRLEVLLVRDCPLVNDVSPFAHCLLELDASRSCGISSAVLGRCRRLQVLNASENETICTLEPLLAQGLRELDAGKQRFLSDAVLANATGLVKLGANFNEAVTTIEPFGASLRELHARSSGLDAAGIFLSATNLVYLDASSTRSVQVDLTTPFSSSLSTLRELEATDVSSINDVVLSTATNLCWIDVSRNRNITSLHSFGRSLRHLVANGADCGLTNEGVSTATYLVTLDKRGNRHLTTIEPFQRTLQELATNSKTHSLMVENAPNLHHLKQNEKEAANGFYETRFFDQCRDTVTYQL